MSKKPERDQDWKNDPLENTPPVRGSGNFLKDRGYSDPTETRIKFDLVYPRPQTERWVIWLHSRNLMVCWQRRFSV